MKTSFYVLFILMFFNIHGQNNTTFELNYDQSGNLSERKILAISLGRFNTSISNESAPKPSLFKISPNPTVEYLNIELKDKSEFITAQIDLHALTGQLIRSFPYYGENLKKLEVNGLVSGVYILTIHYSSKEKEIHKIIINN